MLTSMFTPSSLRSGDTWPPNFEHDCFNYRGQYYDPLESSREHNYISQIQIKELQQSIHMITALVFVLLFSRTTFASTGLKATSISSTLSFSVSIFNFG